MRLAENDVSDDDRTVAAVAKEIKAYLARHPHAADSAAGIRTSWLSAQLADAPGDRVEKAIDWLMSHGVIESRSLPDGTVLYATSRRAK